MGRILKTKYDFVASIGNYCACAMNLSRHFLRTMSSPLDWIGTTDPDSLTRHVAMLCSGFEGFMRPGSLDVMDISSLSAAERAQITHAHCYDRGTGMHMYHDFPLDRPPREAYDEVRAKYDRRIARFDATLRSVGKSLLVFQTRFCDPSREEILAAAATLRKRFGEGRVDLLVIAHVEGKPSLDLLELAPGVYSARAWFYRPERHWVLGDLALSDRVYARIRCRGKFARRVRARLENWKNKVFRRRKRESVFA